MPPLWRPMLAASVHDLVATLHPHLHAIALEAGDIALSFFNRGAPTTARIWSKDEGSPVTEADVAVDTFLKVRLSESSARGRLAFRGDRRRPGRAQAAPRLDRRSDRRHARLSRPAIRTGRSPSPSSPTVGRCSASSMRPPTAASTRRRSAAAPGRDGAPIAVSAPPSRRRAGRRPEAARRPASSAIRRPLERLAEGALPRAAPRAGRRGRDRPRPRVAPIPATGTSPPPTSSSHEAGGRLTDLRGRRPRLQPGRSRSMASSLAASARLHPPLIEAMTAPKRRDGPGRASTLPTPSERPP